MSFNPKQKNQISDPFNSSIEIQKPTRKKLVLGGFTILLLLEYLTVFLATYLIYFK